MEGSKLACVVCGSISTLKRCTRCRTVVYCSREHQVKDWSKHKRTCNTAIGTHSTPQIAKQCDNNVNNAGSTRETGVNTSDLIAHCDRTPNQKDQTCDENVNNVKSNSDIGVKTVVLDSERAFNTYENEDNTSDAEPSFAVASEENSSDQVTNKDRDVERNNLETDKRNKVTVEDLGEDSDDEQKNCDENNENSVCENKEQTNKSVDDLPIKSNTPKDTPNVMNSADDDDGIPFDDRPYRAIDFPKCHFKEEDRIARFASKQLLENGYCVMDGLINEKLAEDVLKEMKQMDNDSKLKAGLLAGGVTSGDDAQKVQKTSIRNDRVAWVQGNEDEIPNINIVIDKLDLLTFLMNKHISAPENCFIEDRTKVMLACYPGNGTHYKRHIDNPKKDGRKLTCILYLNKDWDIQTDGGLLRILPAGKDTYVDVAPVFNRMLMFWSDSRNPHEVQPAYKMRYAMTVWYYDQLERKKAKEQELAEETSMISGQVALLELHKKDMEKKALEVQIENHAMKAVNSLSEEELLGVASMLEGRNDKKTVLEMLGIAGSIQDVLINVLKLRGMLKR